MRIHTDKTSEVRAAIWRATGALPGVYAEVSEYGSRSRAGALELRLTGNSPRYTADNQDRAATWDEWGVVLAAVFAADPHAICGTAKRPVYAGVNDFHWQTGERFVHAPPAIETGGRALPEDTHTSHHWDYVARDTVECTKCTAVRYAPLRG